jgi:hypothetical protein
MARAARASESPGDEDDWRKRKRCRLDGCSPAAHPPLDSPPSRFWPVSGWKPQARAGPGPPFKRHVARRRLGLRAAPHFAARLGRPLPSSLRGSPATARIMAGREWASAARGVRRAARRSPDACARPRLSHDRRQAAGAPATLQTSGASGPLLPAGQASRPRAGTATHQQATIRTAPRLRVTTWNVTQCTGLRAGVPLACNGNGREKGVALPYNAGGP